MDLPSLIFLALAAAVYPTLLAGVALILGRPNPLRLLVAFLAGGMGVSIVAGLLIVNAIESSGAVQTSNHSTKPVVDIVVGVCSLTAAWAIWSGRIDLRRAGRRRRSSPPSDRGPSLTSRALASGSLAMAMVAGVVLNLPGIWYLDALTAIAKANPSGVSTFAQILLFNVIMFALIEIPTAMYIFAPARAAATVTTGTEWAHRNTHNIAVVIALLVGVWLTGKGILAL